MDSTRYPESVRTVEVSEQSQSIGDFLDWLGSQGILLCELDPRIDRYYPTRVSVEKLLARYFGVDLDAREREFKSMLAELKDAREHRI